MDAHEHMVGGGDAGSALMMLSQIAANGSIPSRSPKPAGKSFLNLHHHQQVPGQIPSSSIASPQHAMKKPMINVLALLQHVNTLEERVRQLEATVGIQRKSDSSASSSVPSSAATSPLTLNATTNLPPTLKSIRFNHSMPQVTGTRTEDYQQRSAPQLSNLQSPPTTSTWPSHPGMVLKDATVKDVQRPVLDKVCLPLLEKCYDPEKLELMDLVDDLEKHHFYHIDRRILMSAVRRWFRKRREEMGSRVFMLCKSAELINLEPADIKDFLRSLKDNHELLDKIRARAGLDIKDEQQARQFCLEKIFSYFRRKIVNATASP